MIKINNYLNNFNMAKSEKSFDTKKDRFETPNFKSIYDIKGLSFGNIYNCGEKAPKEFNEIIDAINKDDFETAKRIINESKDIEKLFDSVDNGENNFIDFIFQAVQFRHESQGLEVADIAANALFKANPEKYCKLITKPKEFSLVNEALKAVEYQNYDYIENIKSNLARSGNENLLAEALKFKEQGYNIALTAAIYKNDALLKEIENCADFSGNKEVLTQILTEFGPANISALFSSVENTDGTTFNEIMRMLYMHRIDNKGFVKSVLKSNEQGYNVAMYDCRQNNNGLGYINGFQKYLQYADEPEAFGELYTEKEFSGNRNALFFALQSRKYEKFNAIVEQMIKAKQFLALDDALTTRTRKESWNCADVLAYHNKDKEFAFLLKTLLENDMDKTVVKMLTPEVDDDNILLELDGDDVNNVSDIVITTLIDLNQFELLERLLTQKNNCGDNFIFSLQKGKTPEVVSKIIETLIDAKQYKLVDRLLKEKDNSGNTIKFEF